MATPIIREEARHRLDAGDTLVEPLPELHYRESNLLGAINFPHVEVDEQVRRLLRDLDAEIVDSSDRQSETITPHCPVQLGSTRVYDYADGEADWIASGLSTDTTAEVTR